MTKAISNQLLQAGTSLKKTRLAADNALSCLAQVEGFAEATKALVTRIECGNGETLTEAEEARRGALIADWLGLARCEDKPDRWETPIGSKTDVGLFRTVKRLVEEGK